MQFISVKKWSVAGCFWLFVFFSEACYPVSFGLPDCSAFMSRLATSLKYRAPAINHVAAAIAGTLGSAVITGVNVLSPGNLILTALSQGDALLQQFGVRDTRMRRAALCCRRGAVVAGIVLPAVVAPTGSAALWVFGTTAASYIAHITQAFLMRKLCSFYMSKRSKKYVEPWLLAAGQFMTTLAMLRLHGEPLDGRACLAAWVKRIGAAELPPECQPVNALIEPLPEDLQGRTFWLVAEIDPNPYHCLAPDELQSGAAVTTGQFCTYLHGWFFHEGLLRSMVRPGLCLEVARSIDFNTPRLTPCSQLVPFQLWDYDPVCDLLRIGVNPRLLIVLNRKGRVVNWNNCYALTDNLDKASIQDALGGEHSFEKKDTAQLEVLYRVEQYHQVEPKSRFSSSLPIQYPIALSDVDALKEDYFRDFINWIRPLEYPLEYSRDIDYFPGAVANSNVSGEYSGQFSHLSYDRGNSHSMDTEETAAMESWFSTGLYAPANKIIRVQVDNLLESNHNLNPAAGFKLRLGVHSNELCFSNARNSGRLDRPWRVSKRFLLHEGENLVRSQYGGTVLLSRQGNERPEGRVTVRNAVPAPYFIRGKTKPWQWLAQINQAVAPWAELEGAQCTLHLPVAVAKTIEKPEELLAVYDRIVSNCRWLAGADKAKKSSEAASGQWVFDRQHIVQDILRVDPEAVHSGFPVTVDESWHIADLENMNYWGVFCQLGHNFQSTPLTGAFDKAALAGLFALYNQDQFGQLSRLFIGQCYSRAIAKVRSGQMVLAEAEPLEQLVFLMQIKHFIAESSKEERGANEETQDAGWLFYRRLNSYYRALPGASKIAASRQQQFDSFYTLASLISGYDLREHFAAWNVIISDKERQSIRKYGLSEPSTIISDINMELFEYK